MGQQWKPLAIKDSTFGTVKSCPSERNLQTSDLRSLLYWDSQSLFCRGYMDFVILKTHLKFDLTFVRVLGIQKRMEAHLKRQMVQSGLRSVRWQQPKEGTTLSFLERWHLSY